MRENQRQQVVVRRIMRVHVAVGHARGDGGAEEVLVEHFVELGAEVQTGRGRTGRWFAHQHHGITPDVMTRAKGLGGGVPIGACLAAPRADVFEPGDHGSTFGGNPLACAAALAVLNVIERDGLVGHAAEMGDVLRDALLDLGANDVRGLGLMQAFEFAEPRAKAFQLACLEAGLIVNAVDEHSVRLVPPLIITAEEIDRAHATMKKVAG